MGMSRLTLRLLSQISSAEIFVIGAVAKAVATTLTYPLQTVQAILRVSTMLCLWISLMIFYIFLLSNLPVWCFYVKTIETK